MFKAREGRGGRDHKAKPIGGRGKRRQLLLDKQKAARRDLTTHARDLAEKGRTGQATQVENKENGADPQQVQMDQQEGEAQTKLTKQQRQQNVREYWASQLTLPDWLTNIDLPPDLSTGWYARPRPEGTRCLVVAAYGNTVSRKRNGGVLHRFSSSLPCGSGSTREKGATCILDCIFHAANQTYYVLDLMCWKGYNLYDSNTEFRLWWLQSKLGETTVSEVSKFNKYRFMPVPCHLATTEGLQMAYPDVPSKGGDQGQFCKHGFVQDGILLIHKETHYVLGLSPLMLAWKDAHCSRFFVDTNDGKTITQNQVAVLSVHAGGAVKTADDQVLGLVPAGLLDELKIPDKTLVKFSFKGLDVANRKPDGLNFVGLASKSRMEADSWSKVVFQYNARNGSHVDMDTIVRYATEGPS